MKFTEALIELSNGRSIYRSDSIVYHEHFGFMAVYFGQDLIGFTAPSIWDMQQDDWEIEK